MRERRRKEGGRGEGKEDQLSRREGVRGRRRRSQGGVRRKGVGGGREGLGLGGGGGRDV